MVKHTQTIHRQKPTNCLSVFEHFVELVLKWLRYNNFYSIWQSHNLIETFLISCQNFYQVYKSSFFFREALRWHKAYRRQTIPCEKLQKLDFRNTGCSRLIDLTPPPSSLVKQDLAGKKQDTEGKIEN